MNNKKAQQLTFSGAPALIVIFGLVVLIVSAMAVGISSFRSSGSNIETLTEFDVNSTFTALNNTAVNFASTEHPTAIDCTGTKIYNNSNLADITSLFTVSGCTATLSAVSAYNNTVYTANYTWSYNGYTHAYNISSNGLVGLDNFSKQTPTLGTMIGIGLIIVVIIAAFGAFIMNKGPGL